MQFVEDTTLFMGSKEEIAFALNEIEIVGSFSGLMLDWNKTQGMWVGKLNNCKDKKENKKFSFGRLSIITY